MKPIVKLFLYILLGAVVCSIGILGLKRWQSKATQALISHHSVQANALIIVDATWCRPCTKRRASWQRLSEDYRETARIYWLDVSHKTSRKESIKTAFESGFGAWLSQHKTQPGTIAVLLPGHHTPSLSIPAELDGMTTRLLLEPWLN